MLICTRIPQSAQPLSVNVKSKVDISRPSAVCLSSKGLVLGEVNCLITYSVRPCLRSAALCLGLCRSRVIGWEVANCLRLHLQKPEHNPVDLPPTRRPDRSLHVHGVQVSYALCHISVCSLRLIFYDNFLSVSHTHSSVTS